MSKDAPIVDGALAYDCPYTSVVYVLVVRNALQVPLMDHNLVSSFIMRADGDVVNCVPKIHCEDPAVDKHCIAFDNSNLWILLQLNGVFSYFHTIVSTERELNECEKVLLTPDSRD